MKKIQTGFTLPELMIVVAIIGVLSSIMIPIVNQYAVRAKVSEVLLAFGTCRNMITEAYSYSDESPGAMSFGCESTIPTSRYVNAIKTDDDGIIWVELSQAFNDARLNFQTITLAPKAGGGGLPEFGGVTRISYWRCGSPLDTSAGVMGSPGTTVPRKFLPGSCGGN